MEDSDSLSVGRVKAGEDDAYRALVDRYSRGVFRLAYRMTGNEQDAEDVVQETFLRAFRHLNRWESRSSFGTWVHRIAANYSLDLPRIRRRHAEVSQSEALAGSLAAAGPGPARLLYSSIVQRQVSDTLDTLTRQERAAFVLRHFEDQSIDEIGRTLGLSANSAKQSIFRAVQKLRRALEPLVNNSL
jgi:RNA polymerase sigma-70 factor, ECF subfamily